MYGWNVVIVLYRFGIGRFTTVEEVDYTVNKCVQQVKHLRSMRYRHHLISTLSIAPLNSPLWEMIQEGVDIKSIQWTQH